MDCSMPGCCVLHSLLEFAQIPVHGVDDVIFPLPLLSSSPGLLPGAEEGLRGEELRVMLHKSVSQFGL